MDPHEVEGAVNNCFKDPLLAKFPPLRDRLEKYLFHFTFWILSDVFKAINMKIERRCLI